MKVAGVQHVSNYITVRRRITPLPGMVPRSYSLKETLEVVNTERNKRVGNAYDFLVHLDYN